MISVSWPIMSLGWTKNIGVPCAPMRVGPSIRLPCASNHSRAASASAVTPADLALPPAAEGTAEIAARVARARQIQMTRNDGMTNAALAQQKLDKIAEPDPDGRKLLIQAAETLNLTARGYHRVLRVARTLADLAGSEQIHRLHIAEALSHRRARKGLVTGGAGASNTHGNTSRNRPKNPFYAG